MLSHRNPLILISTKLPYLDLVINSIDGSKNMIKIGCFKENYCVGTQYLLLYLHYQ